jgi:hypothetical protein
MGALQHAGHGLGDFSEARLLLLLFGCGGRRWQGEQRSREKREKAEGLHKKVLNWSP